MGYRRRIYFTDQQKAEIGDHEQDPLGSSK